jgi:hypothetical protein
MFELARFLSTGLYLVDCHYTSSNLPPSHLYLYLYQQLLNFANNNENMTQVGNKAQKEKIVDEHGRRWLQFVVCFSYSDVIL